MIEKLKTFFGKCVRVWHLLKKPDKSEFMLIAKISALGILAIGLAGFIISLLVQFLGL